MQRNVSKKSYLREVILGGQDGLVNVLGIVLAVSVATSDTKLIIITGLAATFAESISMGAVSFTSSRAVKDENRANSTLDTEGTPWVNAIWVFLFSMVGSLIPLIPFFFLGTANARLVAVFISALALFSLGFAKGKITLGNPVREGFTMAMIGMLAAIAGYVIGSVLGVVV